MRSKLFVPGSRRDFFEKALCSEADALSFDLEDAVPEDGKTAARARLRDFLGTEAVTGAAKTLILRVNSYGSAHFEADLEALAGTRIHFVNLPKVEEPETARLAIGEVIGAFPHARLLLNIETAGGLARVREIARAHENIAGLQIGANDLFERLRIDRSDPLNVRFLMWQVRMAAAEAGLFAYDGAWPRLNDTDGFEREAKMAWSMGFLGKSCIHPRQVTIANAIFDRSGELAEARRLVDAARTAAASGKGAFLLDGRMIDAPAIAHAEALLAKGGDPQ